MLSFLAGERRRSETADEPVNVTARPHPRDTHRMQVTFELPPVNGTRKRVRKTAPAGLDKDGAIAWGKKLEREVLREHMQAHLQPAASKEDTEPKKTAPKLPKSKTPTLEQFWVSTMEPYLEQRAPSTGLAWRQIFKDHLRPVLGRVPLDAIDRAKIRELEAHSAKTMRSVYSRNTVKQKIQRILALAVAEEVIPAAVAFEISSKIKLEPRPKDKKPVYRADEIAMVKSAARECGPVHLAMVLLMMDTGLRLQEVCALRWPDIDWAAGVIIVRNNFSAGKAWIPKGKKAAPVGMTLELAEALRSLPKVADFVLVRPDREGEHMTRGILRGMLADVLERAGVARLSFHRLRASGLTALARSGAPGWIVQAQARHARLETTQAHYINLEEIETAQRAAAYLMNPVAAPAVFSATVRPPPATHPQIGPSGLN